MSLEIVCKPERDLTIFIVKGQPTVAEILEAYREAKDRFGLTKHTIWDGREASLTHWQPFDLELLDQLIALIQNSDPGRSGGRSALLVASQDSAAMLKKFVLLNYRVPQHRKIVFTLEAALAWVRPEGSANESSIQASSPRPSLQD